MKRISPASWNNVNLHGKYEFNKNSANMSFSNLNKLIKDKILADDILHDQEKALFDGEDS